MTTHTPARRVLAALVAAFALAFATPAQADPQTDVVTEIGWRWRTDAPLSTINADINDGYRLVDIEVQSSSPLLFNAVFVRNTGDYRKTWWWYYDQSLLEVGPRMAQHNARMIDVESYTTNEGRRYAILLVENTGSDYAAEHGWAGSLSKTHLQVWVNNNPDKRLLDLQPFLSGSEIRYTFIWIENSGQHHRNWSYYLDTTPSFIQSSLAQNGHRLIDLEVTDDTTRFSAIAVQPDGNAWYWFHGLRFDEVERAALQHASRPIDLQRYRTVTGEERYGMIVRRNSNDLTVLTTVAQRLLLPLSASSGLLLREIGAGSETFAATFDTEVFEPSNLISTAHHFAALHQVRVGTESLVAPVTERTGLTGSCPNGTNPVTRPLWSVLSQMMSSNSYTATDAIRMRYGTNVIEATCDLYGAANIELNHVVGCFCGQPRNEGTLKDFAALHDAVADGTLGGYADWFWDLMQNSDEFGMGGFSTADVLDQELAASALDAEERIAFRNAVYLAHKGGAYTCVLGGVRSVFRSRGAYVRLPFRSGCDIDMREYFIGAWVDDAPNSFAADNSVGVALGLLFLDRVRAAIQSWEAADCDPFVNYCNANPNSTGLIGRCTATGSPYVHRNDLQVHASQLPLHSWGSLLVSRSRGFTPNPGGSQGNLCLRGSIGRYFNAIMSTGSTGTLSLSIDLDSIPAPSGPGFSVMAGEKLDFQWWHRDTSPGGASSNFTEGLEVRFF